MSAYNQRKLQLTPSLIESARVLSTNPLMSAPELAKHLKIHRMTAWQKIQTLIRLGVMVHDRGHWRIELPDAVKSQSPE